MFTIKYTQTEHTTNMDNYDIPKDRESDYIYAKTIEELKQKCLDFIRNKEKIIAQKEQLFSTRTVCSWNTSNWTAFNSTSFSINIQASFITI